VCFLYGSYYTGSIKKQQEITGRIVERRQATK
jgi:hypothetical protein